MTEVSAGKWSDLTARLLSALAMVIIGVVCAWQGGTWFRTLVAVVAALMMWELMRMRAPARRELALAVGGFAGAAVILYPLAASPWSIGLVLAPAIVAALGCAPHWRIGSVYALVIVIGSDTLIGIRDHLGFGWLVWIILIVVATDVAGYFAGKAMGGPKFWPAVSPKKTWSGTVAGWIAAGFVGAVFGLGSGVMGLVVLLSLLLSFAGQLGDIAESAIKRRSGVKDSSRLIPGHGGVLDRFDALLGASLVLLVVAALTGFPPGLV